MPHLGGHDLDGSLRALGERQTLAMFLQGGHQIVPVLKDPLVVNLVGLELVHEQVASDCALFSSQAIPTVCLGFGPERRSSSFIISRMRSLSNGGGTM